MSRSWSPRPRRRYAPQPPRSLWRRLFDYCLTIVLLGLLILLAARLDRFETREAAGAAIVNDGDSITLGATRIRMRGIDAPEYQQTCRRGGADYACGKLARQSLVQLIGGRPVSCSGWQQDRFGRLLGDCKAGGVDLNRAQVEAGWAVAYGDFETEEDGA
ncbi:MAG: thermonuclease family protein, partial [Mesorhizobium sp.]